MPNLETERLRLTPFAAADFTRFVENMLTDPRVVRFYYSYRYLNDIEAIRKKAQSDFMDEFEDAQRHFASARERSGKIMAAYNDDVLPQYAAVIDKIDASLDMIREKLGE